MAYSSVGRLLASYFSTRETLHTFSGPRRADSCQTDLECHASSRAAHLGPSDTRAAAHRANNPEMIGDAPKIALKIAEHTHKTPSARAARPRHGRTPAKRPTTSKQTTT